MRRPKKRAKKRGRKKAARRAKPKRARKKSARRGARRKVAKRAPTRKRAKKSAKKKSAKKKVAKKKAPRKRRGKKVVVVLDPKKPLGAKKTHLDSSKGDKIQWRNRDTIEHAIHFTSWPFTGVMHDILVPARGTSEVLTISAAAGHGVSYDYEVIPDVAYAPGTPPDGPAVISD
jgi:hypothetical protein